MSLRWLIFYLASLGCVSAAMNCSYKALIQHLGLDSDDIQLTSLRPVDNWKNAVTIFTDLLVTSITEVNEKSQSISIQITLSHGWGNDYTVWIPDDFCGITSCTVKKDMVWTPDIVITESIKTEFATMENPYVQLTSKGLVVTTNVLAVTTACKMNLHLFPFDTQSCNFTLQSSVHSIDELQIRPFSDASILTLSSQRAFQTQGEWELLSINMSSSTVVSIGDEHDQLIYQITMKRKPVLYIIDFLMPVFYCLILDLASFFVESSGGEKLGFKVTLLLAISVLLLLLKDMLPSTANDVPLIGIYCVVIFTLIGISVLETIFVNFLMDKGSKSISVTPMQSTSATSGSVKDTEGSGDSVTDRNQEFSLVLKQILVGFQAQNQQEKKCLSWTRVARIIDIIFFFLYASTVVAFLVVLCTAWFP